MRTSPIHYIAPSAISIIPNANGSHRDLAVYIANKTKIKVYCPRAGIGKENGEYQEWVLTGRNRRLGDTTGNVPYTVYARLRKGSNDAYLVLAPKRQRGGEWEDKYPFVTPEEGVTTDVGAGFTDEIAESLNSYWYVRLGNVSVAEDGERSITIDTGILGTDDYNTSWGISPDLFPLRIELGCTVNGEDVGLNPYIYWEQSLLLTATLTEGWTGTDIQRFDHWEIIRNSGDDAADKDWLLTDPRKDSFSVSGEITLRHLRNNDDFNGAVASTFTIMAMERNPDYEPGTELAPFLVLRTTTVTIYSEIIERYELAFTTIIMGYDPESNTYNPATGVGVRIRATDQRGDVWNVTNGQYLAMGLQAFYASAGSDFPSTPNLVFSGNNDAVAVGNIPVSAFASQQSVNVRLTNAAGAELTLETIAFVRDGEDSKEREWIYRLNSKLGYDAWGGTAGGQTVSGQTDGVYNCYLVDDFVPSGWTDDPSGTVAQGDIEYASWRDYDRAHKRWGAFQEPKIWSRYAKDGATIQASCSVGSIAVECDASGKVKTGVSLSAVFSLNINGAATPTPTVTVKSKPAGVVIQTRSDVTAIPANGAQVRITQGTNRNNLNGGIIFTVSYGTSSAEFVLPVICSNNGQGEASVSCSPGSFSVPCTTAGVVKTAIDTTLELTWQMKVGGNPAVVSNVVVKSKSANIGVVKNSNSSFSLSIPRTLPKEELDTGITFTVTGTYGGDTYQKDYFFALVGAQQGEPGVNVMLSNDTVILSQEVESPYSIDLATAFTDVFVDEGGDDQTNFTVAVGTGTDAPVRCTAEIDGNNVSRVKITSILQSEGAYYDNGYVIILVTYAGETYRKKFNFYVNLLGTWKETVVADTKSAIAQSNLFSLDANGNIVESQYLGNYIQSSSRSISQLQETVGDANGGLVKRVSTVEQTASNINLSVENVLSGLLATGINITDKLIVITSDSFKVRNQQGDETLYVNERGDVTIAGYLTEKITVVNNADDWTNLCFPVCGINNIEDRISPSAENVTVYGDSEGLTRTGYPMMTNNEVYYNEQPNLEYIIGKHWGSPYENLGMLDLCKCTGSIDFEFQPRTANGTLVESVVFLPWIQFNAGDACSEVELPAADAMAVRLIPNYGNDVYKGSKLFTSTDNEVRKYPPYTRYLRHGAPAGGVASATNILPNGYALHFNIQLKNTVNNGVMFSASDLRFLNQTGNAITLGTARICYYFVTKKGAETAVTQCDDQETTIALSTTNVKLYAYILINNTYTTNSVLLAEYNGYGMQFMRTVTTFGNQAKHYVTYDEMLAMLGKRFVIHNNSATDMYVIYDTHQSDYIHPNGTGWVILPANTSLGFTLQQVLVDAGSITTFRRGQTGNESVQTYLKMPMLYFAPDEVDSVVIDFSRAAFNSQNFGEQVYFED